MFYLRHSHFQLDRHEEALIDTNASLALLPTSFNALRIRARIYFHLEKYDNAIADFESAIQQAKTEGDSTENDVRALQNELKKAETALKMNTSTAAGLGNPFYIPQTRPPPQKKKQHPETPTYAGRQRGPPRLS